MKTDLQGLAKNLIQVLDMKKKHSLPQKAFVNHLKHLSVCAKTKIGFSLDKKCT